MKSKKRKQGTPNSKKVSSHRPPPKPATATPSALEAVDVNSSVSSADFSGKEGSVPFRVGDTVYVQSNCSPGFNILGGGGKISKVNADGTYNVSYFVGSSDRKLSAKLLSNVVPALPESRHSPTTRKARSSAGGHAGCSEDPYSSTAAATIGCSAHHSVHSGPHNGTYRKTV